MIKTYNTSCRKRAENTRSVVGYVKLSGHSMREEIPDGKVHGTNMGPTWFLSAPDGPNVGLMNLAIKVDLSL